TALLLPAVQSAREAGRKSVCANNLHNLGLAMLNFQESKRYFPGYVYRIEQGKDLPASWAVMLLPYLEQNPTWANWTNSATTVATSPTLLTTSMSVYVCPSNPPTTIGKDSLAYVVNCGAIKALNDTQQPTTEWSADGVCHDLYFGGQRVSL